MDMILRDDHNIKVPEFTQMYLGDSKKQAEFNRSKLLETLGPRIKILATIDTSRSGTVVNGRVYPAKEMRSGNATWTTPYRKPFLKQHPADGMFGQADEPLVQGRVVGGKFVAIKDDITNDWINPPVRDEGSGMVLNTVEISDRDAVEAIIDGRQLTVSVGMVPAKMLCPFCLLDWKASMATTHAPPDKCDHRPGNVYDADFKSFKGKMPFYFVTRGIVYDHIAATYRPAQPYAAILGWEALTDSLSFLGGDALTGDMASLALCDEAGHIVRLGAPVDEDRAAPPLGEAEAVVLSCMDTAGVLDLGPDAEDGWDAADIEAAISRVRSDGTLQKYQAQLKGKVLGTKGALPCADTALADASLKMLGRYTGKNRDIVGLKLMDIRSKTSNEPIEVVVPVVEPPPPVVETLKDGDTKMEDKELRDTITGLEKSLADALAANVILQRDLDAANGQLAEVAKVAHDSLVKEVFELRVKLNKPDVKDLNDEAKKAYLEKITLRSDVSLKDSLADLSCEVVADTAAPIETPDHAAEPPANQAETQPGTDPKPVADEAPKSNRDKVKAIKEKFRAKK